MKEKANENFHLVKIDFLRGVAISMVFLFHASLILYSKYFIDEYSSNGLLAIPNYKSLLYLFSPIANGWIGVELFFVISGFLIHLIYLRKESSFTLKAFFSKRFWRIYPPYMIVLVFFFIARFKVGEFTFFDFISHVFMVHNLSDKTFFSIDAPFWSLALEMQMYLVYPLFLWLRKNAGIDKAFILVILLSVVFGIVGVVFHHFGTKNAFHSSLPRYWFIWCAGAYVAERFYQGKITLKMPGVWFAVFYILFVASKYTIYTSKLTMFFSAITCVAFLEWILYARFFESKSLFLKWFISFVSLTGLCSYSFYLIHFPYLSNLISLISTDLHFAFLTNAFSVICSFLIFLFISYSFYCFIEIPSIQMGERMRRHSK